MKPIDIFNKLIALSEVENYFGDIEPFDTKQEPHKRYGIGENSIVFRGIDNYITFKDCLNDLYLFHSTISKTYSFEQFEKDFISHVRPYFINKKTIDQSEVDNFYKRILDIKLQKYTIIRGIHGLKLNNPSNYLNIGPVTIYNFQNHKQVIEIKTKLNPSMLWHNWHYEYFSTIAVEARHYNKAQELADAIFDQFELFIRFSLGRYSEEYDVSIVSLKPWYYDKTIIIHDDQSVTTPSRLKGAHSQIPIDDPYFHDHKIGHDKLWAYLNKNTLNQFENRLLSAIEWIGRANVEPNIKNRFIQYIISFESLFTISEKTLITPSIANQIAESFAFLLGTTYDQRIIIEKRIKYLYELRSAIAHGYNKNITIEEANEACVFAVEMTRKFLYDPKLHKISKSEDLSKHIKELKYQ